MKRLITVAIILLVIIAAIPAVVLANTTIAFTQPTSTVINSNTAEFSGTITISEAPPADLFYVYKVFSGDTNIILNQSTRTNPVTVNDSWTRTGRLFNNEFAFTADFQEYIGPARVRLEIWQGSNLFAEKEIAVDVRPVKLTFKEPNNLVIYDDSFRFTAYTESLLEVNLLYKFKVLDAANNIIQEGTLIQPDWVHYVDGLYKNTLQFTTNFRSYKGRATIILEATSRYQTYSTRLSVNVVEEYTKQQTTPFKNYGEKISYLARQLRFYGYGPHRNHGQAMKACLTDAEFRSFTTPGQVDSFLNSHFRLPSSTSKGKK